MELTKRERNQIFETLKDKGIDPSRCAFIPEGVGDPESGEEGDRAEIYHFSSDSYFQFWQPDGTDSFRVSWLVYDDGPSETDAGYAEWPAVLGRLAVWAEELQYAEAHPDFWEELEDLRALRAQGFQGLEDRASFTAEEQAAISSRIEEIKREVRENPELTAEHVSSVEQKLDDLVDASRHVRRKDWRVMLYGTAFGMIVNDTVPPHVVQGITISVITGLGHILGLGGIPPSLPPSA